MTRVNPELETAALTMGSEDNYGLYELIWSFRTNFFRDHRVIETRQVEEEVLRDLLSNGWFS